MSVFSASMNHRSFWWQITLLCFVLGLLLAAAAHTASQINRTGVGPSRTGFVYGNGTPISTDKAKEYENEIKKLREHSTELEKKLANRDDATSTINKELQETKLFAGLTDAVGPGVQLSLDDSHKHGAMPTNTEPLGNLTQQLPNLIHEHDLASVVNELKASGAEAIAVNGQRIVGSSSIRCVGPVIHVNNVPAAPPYIIQAIGDPKNLLSTLNMQGGVLEDLRRFDQNMIRIEKKDKLLLTAFAGKTEMRFARTPKPVKHDSEGSQAESKEAQKEK